MCQSRDFPTELCCNTIIHLLFHYFVLHRSPLHFKFNFKNILVFFVVAQLATVQLVTVLLEYHTTVTVVLRVSQVRQVVAKPISILFIVE